MEEIWKDVDGYPGYQVSNYGRVKSFRTNHGNISKDKFKILKHGTDKFGYLHYSLSNKNKFKPIKAHRLVGFAFIPNPDNKPQINHRDGVKNHNHVSNLEWCTASENRLHAFKTGLCKPTKVFGNFGSLNNNSKEIYQFSMDGTFIKKYDAIMYACEETGAAATHVGQCAKGKRKSSGGFKWSYTNLLE